MKLGIIPLGNHARRRVLPSLKGTGFEVISIYGRSKERIEPFCQEIGAEAYSDLDAFLSSDIEAVYISSPNYLHYSHARKALEKGKHVLLEKQMTLSFKEADELVTFAESEGLTLNIGFHLRFHPALSESMNMIQKGKIGQPIQIVGTWAGYSPPEYHSEPLRSWWEKPELSGGGSIMGTGVHVIDSLLTLAKSMPHRVYAWKYPHTDVIDRSFHVLMEYGSFITEAFSSRDLKVPSNDLAVFGTEGQIRVSNFFSTAVDSTLYLNGESVKHLEGVNLYTEEFRAFAESIRGKRSKIATGREGANVVRIVNAANLSLEKGMAIDPAKLD